MRRLMYLIPAIALILLASGAQLAGSARAETQGVSQTEIVLGTHLDLTGPIASWGIPIKNGMEMKVEEINRHGGIHGRKIRLVVEDSGYDPTKAVLATEKLISRDRVFAIVGSLGTPTTGATMPLSLKRGIPYLLPLTAAEFTYKPFDRRKFAFVTPNYDAMRTGLKFLLREGKGKKVGVIYQNDEYGDSVLKGVEDQLKAMGLPLVSITSYERGAVSFGNQVARLRSSKVDLVALGTTIRETVAVMREARKIGWHPDFLVSGAGYAAEVAALGKGDVEKLYGVGQTPIPNEATATPQVMAWMSAYREKYGKEASVPAFSGYLVIDVFALGATNTGADLTVDSLINGLEGIREYQGMFGSAPISFSRDNHIGTVKAFVAQIRNGKWVTLTGFLNYREMN